MSSQGRVLITGADGYLGSLLAAKYLHETDDSLVLWVRAGGREEFAAKRARLETRFAGHLARIQLAAGDLNDEQPFAAVCSDPIRSILHAAAVTRFNCDKSR